MSYEVEQKYRVSDHSALAERLAQIGAVAGALLEQEDAYLRHPARDFGQTNEALRLRRVGGSNAITYKGPRRQGPTKTRQEIEIPFEEGPVAFDGMLRLFENLGFQTVAVIRKTRRPYSLEQGGRRIEVALDSAEGLGHFAEVEALAATEAELATAQDAVLELAAQLGLTDVEPRSYLRMALERGEGLPGDAAGGARNPAGQT